MVRGRQGRRSPCSVEGCTWMVLQCCQVQGLLSPLPLDLPLSWPRGIWGDGQSVAWKHNGISQFMKWWLSNLYWHLKQNSGPVCVVGRAFPCWGNEKGQLFLLGNHRGLSDHVRGMTFYNMVTPRGRKREGKKAMWLAEERGFWDKGVMWEPAGVGHSQLVSCRDAHCFSWSTLVLTLLVCHLARLFGK